MRGRKRKLGNSLFDDMVFALTLMIMAAGSFLLLLVMFFEYVFKRKNFNEAVDEAMGGAYR